MDESERQPHLTRQEAADNEKAVFGQISVDRRVVNPIIRFVAVIIPAGIPCVELSMTQQIHIINEAG